jgi:hypothetical protein
VLKDELPIGYQIESQKGIRLKTFLSNEGGAWKKRPLCTYQRLLNFFSILSQETLPLFCTATPIPNDDWTRCAESCYCDVQMLFDLKADKITEPGFRFHLPAVRVRMSSRGPRAF